MLSYIPITATVSMLIPAPELYLDFSDVPHPIEVAQEIERRVANSPLRLPARSPSSMDLPADIDMKKTKGAGTASVSHLPGHKRAALQRFMSAHPDERVR
jgi:hypothetical protein